MRFFGAAISFFSVFALSLHLATPSHAADLVGATAGELGVSPSGSASYSIPIAVPVGTTGLQPKITLQYDSMAGNGVGGMGWTVGGLATIGRCPTSFHIDGTASGSPGLDPVDYDSNDKFCLNGQRLVPVSGAYGADNTEYRTSQEEFSKIVSYGTAGSGPQYFKVWRKSGEILEFGNTADSRIEALGRADVWVWALNKLSDTAGNYETFSYTEDTVNGGFRISRIDWTGNAAQGLSPYNHVDFIYAARTDVSATYQAGSKITQNQRLTNIKVYADAALFRDYQITYEATPGLSGRSRPISFKECAPNATSGTDCFPPTTFQWSLDGTATVTTLDLSGTPGISGSSYSGYNVSASGDFNGDGRTDMYLVKTNSGGQANGSSSFTDRVFLANSTGSFQTIAVPHSSSLPQDFAVATSGDFNGDGLTDFYAYRADAFGRKNGSTLDKVYLSNGNGTFNVLTLTAAITAGDDFRVMATGDFNGDGLTDLFLSRADDVGRLYPVEMPKFLLGTSSGTFQVAIFEIDFAQFSMIIANAVSATGDFNGDGLTDMYLMRTDKKARKSGSGYSDYYFTSKWAPNGSSGTLIIQVTVAPVVNSFANGYGIANSGDFNGDGLTDFYVIKMDDHGRGQGNLQDSTWLSKGNLTFQVVTGLAAGSQIQDDFKITGSGDFNGDGQSDAYVMKTRDANHPNGAGENGDDYILISEGDGHFTKISLAGAPGIPGSPYPMKDYEVKASGDFNGDGLTDLYLYRAQDDGRSNGNANDYIFQSGWKTPDQLVGITNGLGINSQIAYKPMTDASVYTKGTGSAYPVQEVIAPRYIVSEVKADNGVGGQNVQTYNYTALRAHLKDIGNLGYLTMKVTDQSTGIVTESNYSQDHANFTEGLLTSSKTKAPDGTLLSVQTTSWAVASTMAVDGTPRRFRHSPSSTTVKRDLNNALLGTTTESADYSDGAGNMFNNHGFPRQVTASTQSPDGATTYTKTTDNVYTHNTASWILGRLTSAQVTHQETGKPNIVRSSTFTYNATTGLLLSETVEPGSALSYTKTNTYDGFGAIDTLTETWGSQNNASVKDAGGATATQRVTSFTYDSRRRHKVTETNPLGHSQSSVYDPVTGLATSTTGPNGLVTSWQFDTFGRPTRETRADGTYTTTLREACGGAVACPSNAALKITTNVYGSSGAIAAPTQTLYQDKLYREVRVSTVSLDGTEVHVDTVHDSRGRIVSKSEPYFQGATTVHWTTITYDLINRPLQTTRPDSSTLLQRAHRDEHQRAQPDQERHQGRHGAGSQHHRPSRHHAHLCL